MRPNDSHAKKKGRRYRYYISHRLMQAARMESDGWRIPARELEITILNALIQFLSNDRQLIDLIARPDLNPHLAQSVSNKAKEVRGVLESTNTAAKRELVHAIVERISVSPGHLRIEIDTSKLVVLLAHTAVTNTDSPMNLDVPFTLRRRGVEGKLIIGTSNRVMAEPDDKLVQTIANGRNWFEQIACGEALTVREIAQRDEVDEGDVSRMIGFAFLAPDIVEAIVNGTQPIELTAERLKRLKNLPNTWSAQRRVLGFQS